jgi:hypothetical protein
VLYLDITLIDNTLTWSWKVIAGPVVDAAWSFQILTDEFGKGLHEIKIGGALPIL